MQFQGRVFSRVRGRDTRPRPARPRPRVEVTFDHDDERYLLS